jgi:hypothetical protein
MNKPSLLTAALLFAAAGVAAQEPTPSEFPARVAPESAVVAVTGSTAFCLFELPPEQEGKRRWLNLGIVQYVEFSHNQLKIYYGGGNLGSGHEAILPVSSPEQLQETLDRIRAAAAACR